MLGQREQFEHALRVCHRGCYQRSREVVRLVDNMTASSLGSVTPPKDNLPHMVKGALGHVALNFVYVAMTVVKGMLNVAQISKCAQELGEQGSYKVDGDSVPFVNPLDSHMRSHAVLDKCKVSQVVALIWRVQVI